MRRNLLARAVHQLHPSTQWQQGPPPISLLRLSCLRWTADVATHPNAVMLSLTHQNSHETLERGCNLVIPRCEHLMELGPCIFA